MLSTATAIRFDRPMSRGKTRPSLLACTLKDGEEIEVIAKFAAGCELKHRALLAESISAMLAADLDLPVPEPFVVELSPEFIDAIADNEVRQRAQAGPNVCFGSRKLAPGFLIYPVDKPLPQRLVQTAAEIFAFDHFIANPDRTVANPNLLFNGGELAIYDHELAFFTDGILGWKPPWEDGGASFPKNLPEQFRHVFLEELRGRKIDMGRFSGAFDVITNKRLADYRDALPPEWVEDGGSTDKILAYILELKEKLPLAIDQLVQALQ